ncbi:MAG TPA: sialate O-acetylesterase [Alphaproteobacteria bacterium]|nr:sialate O-acetylesterase [Alphaproteobacteria bacterium]
MAGFVWWQGHKDKGLSTDEYEKHLVNLIHDVRKEFDTPDMPVAVATVGFSGYDMGESYMKIWQAQMNVADAEKHPALAKTVASVDIRPFWRDAGQSPKAQGYHYNQNAETFMLVGDSLGRAMVELHGGKAEPLPLAEASKAKAEATQEQAAEEPAPKPSKEALQAAQKPIVMNKLIPAYVVQHRERLQQEAAWEKAGGKFAVGLLDGSAWRFGLADLYREVGIHTYDWERFGPERDKIEWQYHSFDPPEEASKGRWQYRDITLPDGMENWFKPEFDAKKAGWKTGHAPFAFKNGELAAMRGGCGVSTCRCGETPKTLWEEETLLMRATVKVPKLDPEYRYRLVIGGMSHVYRGDGRAVYIDGKKAYEQSRGVDKRQGALPVGFFIDKELAKAFEDGEVTIAAKAFRGNKGYIAIWMQKMKIPEL